MRKARVMMPRAPPPEPRNFLSSQLPMVYHSSLCPGRERRYEPFSRQHSRTCLLCSGARQGLHQLRLRKMNNNTGPSSPRTCASFPSHGSSICHGHVFDRLLRLRRCSLGGHVGGCRLLCAFHRLHLQHVGVADLPLLEREGFRQVDSEEGLGQFDAVQIRNQRSDTSPGLVSTTSRLAPSHT
ncbi:hypothetical protein VTK73DRAFT_292 [Phialemonium thermophilum]|uniref:Uncharacterized protein n=1 Tax=Phialemonium thermophilum TaxID=223376 RepID=A0ABR3VVU6_9PEZI